MPRKRKRRKIVVVEEDLVPEPTHEGIFCDGCALLSADGLSQPIVGVRYASMAEDDRDLCARCYSGLSRRERRTFVAVGEPQYLSDSDSDEHTNLLEAALGASSSGKEEYKDSDDDGGGQGFVHGEMAVAQAQRTRAVRVENVFSSKEIKKLLDGHVRVRDDCGAVLKKHGEGAQNWSTTFLHTDGIFAAAFPKLRKKILETAAAVDAAEGWGLLDAAPTTPALRCVELHTVGVGGALPEQKHYDHGSLVTVDIMLSSTKEFEGGTLSTLEPDGTLLAHVFERGEATVFVSHKYHCVAPVTAGTRQVLVAEVWAGRERRCAHRCEQHDGDCPISLGISRAAAEIDGLQEGAYGHYLNEMCIALQSTSRLEREKARDALARLQQLSDYTRASLPAAEREHDEQAAQATLSSLRGELLLLSKKELRQRAVDADVSFDDIEEARGSKEELIELILIAAQAAASQQSEGGSSRAHSEAKKALKMEINNQGAIRENHYDMDCGDD